MCNFIKHEMQSQGRPPPFPNGTGVTSESIGSYASCKARLNPRQDVSSEQTATVRAANSTHGKRKGKLCSLAPSADPRPLSLFRSSGSNSSQGMGPQVSHETLKLGAQLVLQLSCVVQLQAIVDLTLQVMQLLLVDLLEALAFLALLQCR